MEKSTKPPKCKVKCSIDPDCHHTARIAHNCHFGDCPPCKQICRKDLPGCQHQCPSPCHDKVEVKVQLTQKAATPWEAAIEGTIGGVRREIKAVACPECQASTKYRLPSTDLSFFSILSNAIMNPMPHRHKFLDSSVAQLAMCR